MYDVNVSKHASKTYMVLDLEDYFGSYLDDIPSGGWTDGSDITDKEHCDNLDKLAYFLYNRNYNGQYTVGAYEPNAWGLYDMHGNIAEWCLDWYGSYNAIPTTDPKGPKSSWRNGRVLRGGSLLLHACACRAASRQYYESMDDTGGDTGFRLVLNSLTKA